MSGELTAWLDSVQCTAPFTLDDARALHGMLRKAVDAPSEVVIRGGSVEVTVWLGDTIVRRVYPIV